MDWANPMDQGEANRFFCYRQVLVKGWCIFGVIAIHVASYAYQMPRFDGLTFSLVFVDALARFAVPVFIILSGFHLGLSRRNQEIVPFYRRTLKFLAVPYVLYSVLFTMIKFRAGLSPRLLLKNLLLGSASPHLWFSLAIIQLYLLHPFLHRWFTKAKRDSPWLFAAFAAQIAWSVATATVFPDPDLPMSSPGIAAQIGKFLFLSNIGYFVLGYWIAEHGDRIVPIFGRKADRCAGALVWVTAASLLALSWWVPLTQGVPFPAISFLPAAQGLLVPLLASAAFLTIFACLRGPWNRKNLVLRQVHALGLYSYGIYYLNPLVVKVASWLLRHPAGLSVDGPLYYVVLLLAVPAATLVTARILSRAPFGRYLV
jgi:surface polysaccharide O-acyltransferase-like enzyme